MSGFSMHDNDDLPTAASSEALIVEQAADATGEPAATWAGDRGRAGNARARWVGGDVRADWCEDFGALVICGTEMREHSRKSIGDRWCFHHRRRHNFDWVVSVPVGESYYGPTAGAEGETTECSDLFPGWSREWEE